MISGYFIYPTMVGLGLVYIPLADVMSVLSVGYVITCASVVLTMATVGFWVGKATGMFPVDAALVTVCHSGLGGTGDVAILIMTRTGVDRILTYAFDLAQTRPKKHLTSATKSNGISISMPYWDERVAAMAAAYPDIAVDKYHIDILTANFVMHPDWFDVVVASNLFGDILSDLGPACTGTIGIAPAPTSTPNASTPACLNPCTAPPPTSPGAESPTPSAKSGALP